MWWWRAILALRPGLLSRMFNPKVDKTVSYLTTPALTTMPNLAVAQDSKAGFTLAGTKDAPLPITNVLDRWDFYNISIPSDVPFGANILIEISTTVNAPLSTRLAYAGDRINSRCRSSRSFSKNLALPFCEIRQGGTWRLTVGRTVANQAYKVKAYLDRMLIILTLLTERSSRNPSCRRTKSHLFSQL